RGTRPRRSGSSASSLPGPPPEWKSSAATSERRRLFEMGMTGRAYDGSRVVYQGAICLVLALAGCAGGLHALHPATAEAPIPAYPLWPEGPHPLLRSVESRTSLDGSRTTVIVHGDRPMNYSLAPQDDHAWTLTLEGVDPRPIEPEIDVATAQLERILVRSTSTATGSPAAELEFRGVGGGVPVTRLDQDDLIMEFDQPAPPASAPAPEDPPSVTKASVGPSVVREETK